MYLEGAVDAGEARQVTGGLRGGRRAAPVQSPGAARHHHSVLWRRDRLNVTQPVPQGSNPRVVTSQWRVPLDVLSLTI